jgi:uncharacterized membrane protein
MARNKNKHAVKRQNPQAQQVIQQTQTQSFSGPIPSPDLLAQYNQIIPDAAERILSMAENEAKHAHSIEMLALTSHAKEKKRGQYFGVLVTALAFITAGVALVLGHPTAAATIGSTTVVGLATAFVVGKKTK